MTSPSNPSAFSAELQAFIISKYDPLLVIVKELNNRLQVAEQEKWRLETRVAQLERRMNACEDPYSQKRPASPATATATTDVHVDTIQTTEDDASRQSKKTKDLTQQIISQEDTLNTAWLFSCQPETPVSAIQVLLEFNPDSTVELETRLWGSEEDMWLAFLEELAEGGIVRHASTDLHELRKFARNALMDLCKGELLLLLRGVPGRHTAAKYPLEITLVAIIASACSEAWQRVEAISPNDLGRIAVVLEGSDIGSRLRAGNARFQIEPLN